MKTEIQILDRLLGLGKGASSVYSPPTQALLIRGAPGSGKTTLALEILARKITQKTPTFGIFLSLEVNPLDAWHAIYQRLSREVLQSLNKPKFQPEKFTIRDGALSSGHRETLQENGDSDMWVHASENTTIVLVGRKWCERTIPPGEWPNVQKILDSNLTHLIDRIQIERARRQLKSLSISRNATLKKLVKITDDSRLLEAIQQLNSEARKPLLYANGLIVLDSVNLFGEHLQNKLGNTGVPDMRTVMYSVWSILEKQREALRQKEYLCDLILIGEHHPGAPYDVSLLSESFACDVEILLSAEPIAGTPTIATNLLGTLGYSFERRQPSKALTEESQSVEIRSFCRILKSRFSPNQSRRCAYDIVVGQGFAFNETYPGDGAVLLFHENAKQKELWESFLSRDVPLQFPALRYALFDRPVMQHMFATQRRFNELHQKTDMFLACFDSYWMTWYWQLGRRSYLRSIFQSRFAQVPSSPSNPARAGWSVALCAMDHFVKEAMRDYRPNDPMPEHLEQRFKEKTKEPLCADWFDANDPDRKLSHDIPEKAIKDLASGSVGLLQPLLKNDLRLFGERRSPIIRELEQPGNQVHLPRFRDDEHYLSVPYNANVSFIVYRQELLEQRLMVSTNWQEGKSRFLEAQAAALSSFRELQTAHNERTRNSGEQKLQWDYAFSELSRTDNAKSNTPQNGQHCSESQISEVRSWEDLILSCTEGEYEPDNDSSGDRDLAASRSKATAHFVIETQTFDSLLCAFLEVFWGFGAHLEINPQYQMTCPFVTEEKLFQAFFLLREMFRLGVIERYSTLIPKRFAARFQDPQRSDWLFARHWYSTFIEILTDRSGELGPHTWTPGQNVELAIAPIPYSHLAHTEDARVGPVSCWGEWHFAVLNGTENQALAVSLINHLMGSNAICERAARCAALPTVEEFYTRYADVPCIRMPEREDISVPTLTYQELRDRIFKVARSRRAIFDYRHCMREIHSVLTHVQHNPNLAVNQLGKQVLEAVDRIHALQYQEMLSH